jgi:hypothetical protein
MLAERAAACTWISMGRSEQKSVSLDALAPIGASREGEEDQPARACPRPA